MVIRVHYLDKNCKKHAIFKSGFKTITEAKKSLFKLKIN